MELPGPLVETSWLERHLAELTLVDVRWAIDTGAQLGAYRAGHIPTAVFADLDVDLSAPAGAAGRHPLTTPEAFAEARANLGIDARPVVAYDDSNGAIAARLWWMLDSIGVPAAILDGALSAWTGELETGDAPRVRVGLPDPVPWPKNQFIVADDIPSALAGGAVLIDARSAERFRGDPNPIDTRPGHIPGAVSRPWTDNMEDGRFAPTDALARQLGTMGIRRDTTLVASCGSGVTACHNLLGARLAGVEDARLYVGSWSEWSHSGLPVAQGE